MLARRHGLAGIAPCAASAMGTHAPVSRVTDDGLAGPFRTSARSANAFDDAFTSYPSQLMDMCVVAATLPHSGYASGCEVPGVLQLRGRVESPTPSSPDPVSAPHLRLVIGWS